MSDAVDILIYLYKFGEPPACMDAADADDSGTVQVDDALDILIYLFNLGQPPLDPGPTNCGPDPTTSDTLDPCAYPQTKC